MLCNAYLGFFLYHKYTIRYEFQFSVSVRQNFALKLYTQLCDSLDVCMSLKSQHLRLVDDVSEFHHTVWRSGQSLVVKKDSVLPDCCVKCGAPAKGQTVDKWLFWHTPILLPIALLSWPFYLLLAIGMRKR